MNAKNGEANTTIPSSGKSAGNFRQPGRRLMAALIATGLAAASVVALANDPGAMEHPGSDRRGNGYEQIDVVHLQAIVHHVMTQASPEQKEKITAIAHAAEPELDALNQQAIAAHRQKVELLLQDAVDTSAIARAQSNEIAAAERLSKRIDSVLVDLVQAMTPEQRAEFRAHAKAHRS